jgi:hypothetical protein
MEMSVTTSPVLTPAPPAQQEEEDRLQMRYEVFLDWAGESNALVE